MYLFIQFTFIFSVTVFVLLGVMVCLYLGEHLSTPVPPQLSEVVYHDALCYVNSASIKRQCDTDCCTLTRKQN